jgi:nitrite reductase (NO-forming)
MLTKQFTTKGDNMASGKFVLVSGAFAALVATGFATSTALAAEGKAEGKADGKADGKAIYNASCAVCHNTLSPKLGDKAAWAPHIKEGVEDMVSTVVKGKGLMPPKAGKPDLSEEDISAAVEYLVAQTR